MRPHCGRLSPTGLWTHTHTHPTISSTFLVRASLCHLRESVFLSCWYFCIKAGFQEEWTKLLRRDKWQPARQGNSFSLKMFFLRRTGSILAPNTCSMTLKNMDIHDKIYKGDTIEGICFRSLFTLLCFDKKYQGPLNILSPLTAGKNSWSVQGSDPGPVKKHYDRIK